MADEEAKNAVNEAVESESTQTESAPVENNSTEAEDTNFDAGFDEEHEDSETSVQSDDGELHSPEAEASEEEDSDEESGEDDKKPQSRAEKRKEQLQTEIDELQTKVDPNTEIRDMVARRNELRQQVEAKNADVYQPATVDELLEQVNPETGDYYNRLEAKLEAMEQEKQVREYNDRVADAQLSIQSEVQQIIRDYPMFDEQSVDYNAEVAKEAAQIMQNSLQIDENTGQIVGTAISPYQLYKTIALASQASARKAQTQGQKAVQKMLSNADPSSGGHGREKSFERMNLAEKEAYLRRRGHDV